MSDNTVVTPPSATVTPPSATVTPPSATPTPMLITIASLAPNAIASAATKYNLTLAEVREVYSMILGLECKESGERCRISGETIRCRRKIIYRKLGVDNVGKAVARILGLETLGMP